MHAEQRGGDPPHARSGERRRAQERRPCERHDLLGQVLEQDVFRSRGNEIPFVRHDHETPPRLDHALRDVLVLAGEPLRGVEEEEGHVRAVDGSDRPDQPVVVDALHPPGTPEPRGVHEPNAAPVPVDHRVDRVSRGAGLLVHDGALFLHQPVEQGRLADVRPADEGEPRLLLEFRFTLGIGQHPDEAVEELTRPPAVQRRHQDRIPRPRAWNAAASGS